MQYYYQPSLSEGVEFIIARAMKSTADDPLDYRKKGPFCLSAIGILVRSLIYWSPI